MTTYSPSAALYASDWFQPDSVMWHELARTFDVAFEAGAKYATATPVQPRVLTTAAQLDALPDRSVVLDVSRHAWQKRGGYWTWECTDSAETLSSDPEDRHKYLNPLSFIPFTLIYDPTAPASPVPAPVPATTEPPHGIGLDGRCAECDAATTEPVRLVDGDPRWKAGARVRGEFEDGTAVEGALVATTWYGDLVPTWHIRYGNSLRSVDIEDREITVYLLAEASDPDAERLSAVVEWLGNHGITTSDSRDLLTLLDSVVKRADA